MGKKKSKASAEIDRIEKLASGIIRVNEPTSTGRRSTNAETRQTEDMEFRNLGIIDVDEPTGVVKAVSDALRGETSLPGTDWKLIGGLAIGGTAAIKAEDGTVLFYLNLMPAPGVKLAEDPNTNYPVLIRRDAAGNVARLSINFAEGETMGYSNLSQQPISPEHAAFLAQMFEKMGLMRKK